MDSRADELTLGEDIGLIVSRILGKQPIRIRTIHGIANVSAKKHSRGWNVGLHYDDGRIVNGFGMNIGHHIPYGTPQIEAIALIDEAALREAYGSAFRDTPTLPIVPESMSNSHSGYGHGV